MALAWVALSLGASPKQQQQQPLAPSEQHAKVPTCKPLPWRPCLGDDAPVQADAPAADPHNSADAAAMDAAPAAGSLRAHVSDAASEIRRCPSFITQPIERVALGYSPELGCACRECSAATLHRPANTSAGPQAPLCFAPADLTDTSSAPYVRLQEFASTKAWSKGGNMFLQCDFNTFDTRIFRPPSDSELEKKVADCISVPTEVRKSQRAVFLFGDSHASNLMLPLVAATQGRAVVRSMFFGGWCLTTPNRTADALREAEKGSATHANWAGQIDRMRRTVYQALDDNLQEGDVVVIHHAPIGNALQCGNRTAYAKWLRNVIMKYVEPRGATLVVPTDWAELGSCSDEEDDSCYQHVWKDARASCGASKDFDGCEISQQAEERREPQLQELVSDFPQNARFMDLYGLFGDPETGKRGAFVPGTKSMWLATSESCPASFETKENCEMRNGHLNIAGQYYLWPHVCEVLSSIWDQ